MMHEPGAATGRATATAEVPVLDPRQAAFLLQLLVGNDPLHLHFESPLWTPAALAEVIHDEFDLRLDPATLQRCLFELGLLPGDRAQACDPELLATRQGARHQLLRAGTIGFLPNASRSASGAMK